MSVEISCDQCGRRAEPGVAGCEWWEVANKASGEDLDFCSTTCLAAYFTARAGTRQLRSLGHAGMGVKQVPTPPSP